MPKPAAIVPNRHIHTTIPPDLAVRMELYLYSEVEGRAPKGAIQQFLIQRIREFFDLKSLDLSPFLGSQPGEHLVQGNTHTIFLLLNHLKGDQHDKDDASS